MGPVMQTRFTLPLLLAALPLAAQQAPSRPAPAADEAVRLDTFVVTGSHIRRTDAETALPVTTIDLAEIDARGAATMAELFETLGIAEPSAITEINNGPQLARGDVASVDLRGIGSGSTLTLLNGRRMVPHPISMAENGVPSLAVNINTVPRALIDRVEVLRDGASAVYGADAAAGVINNRVSRTYTGRQLTMRGSMTQHGGANEAGGTYTHGFRSGKTHVSYTLDYFHRDALAASQRKFASNSDFRLSRRLPAPWNGLPLVDANGTTIYDNDFANTNNVNQWGQWQRGAIQPDFVTFVGSRPANNTGISTSTTPPAGVATMATNGMFYLWPGPAGVSFKQTALSKNIDNPENATYSNWNKWKVLVPATDRVQFATFVDRPLSDRVDFFGDLLFYRAYSRNGREPVNFKNTDDPGIYLPAANPWNPFGVRFYHPTGAPNADGTPRLVGTPADVSLWTGISPGQNADTAGQGFRPRVTEVWSYAWRVLGGLRGRLGSSWEWESALVASGAQTHEYERFQVRESKLRRALGRTDQTAFNPFPVTFRVVNNLITVDRPFANPAAVLDEVYGDEDRFGRTGLFIWDLKANGRMGRLWRGGPIGLATGVEVRHETFADKRSAYSGLNPPGSGAEFPFLREGDNDFLALSSNVPISARQTIFGAYLETALPFVTRENRVPFADSLELTLAGRFERFSIHGQTAKPKASLVWMPVTWVKFRGSVAESFRAPNLVQTNITPLRRQIGAADPYRAEVTGLTTDGSVQRTVFRQGNERLQPEQAKTALAGMVVEVPGVRGLSVSFDWYRLNQNDVIENIGAPGSLLRDELYLDLATQAALSAGTPIDRIDLGSGTAGYKGYTAIKRRPVTDADRAAFAAFNARQTNPAARRAVVGEVESIIDNYINLSGRDIEGYDVGMQWRSPRTRFGTFSFNTDVTRYLRRRSQGDPESPLLNELDRNGRVRWRGSASLSWRQGGWSAGWFTSYFHSFVDTSAATTEAVYRALGQPDYIRVFNDNGITRYVLFVDPFQSHNAWVSYRFGRSSHRWLQGVSARLGLNNVLDVEPPLADETYGYAGGSANARGRQVTLEISRKF